MVRLASQGIAEAAPPELAALIESTRDAIIGLTPEGIVASWNPAAAELYGYTAGEIVGRSAQVLYPEEQRSDEAAVLRRILGGEQVEPYTTDRRHQDGTVLAISVTALPAVSSTGAISGVTTMSWPASGGRPARNRAEEGIDSERSDARDAQDLFEAQIGAERQTARDAQDLFEAQIGAERQTARDALDRFEAQVGAERQTARDALDQFEARAGVERRTARDAREQFEARVDAERRTARDAQEQFEARIGTERRTARDVQGRFDAQRDGDRRDALDRNEGLEAQLQQGQRMENLGQLAGGVAHDFNNLLAVILNYVSFVSEELAAATESDWAEHYESARSDLGQIKRAGERAASLTRQLLAFARREVIQPQVLDLDSVITAVEEMLRRTIGDHVELVISLAGDLWPVLADPGQLEQVLLNLAFNARDAMAAGGTLTIDTGNVIVDDDSTAGGSQSRHGQNVRLRVSDTGTGMSRDVIEHAFEPFYTTKVDGTGTGLGLATVYGIVTQAEGDVRIYSEPGTGTTFTITLPVTAEAPVPVVEVTSFQRVPTGETVLVVEDEPALREVTKRIFARNGYQVITAANGPEALDIARDYPAAIHLLVTDVVMPHMLGKEVAEKMRLIKPGIEVLFMSGYARPVLASQGRLEPHVALVEKPFSEADLMAKAAQVLNGHFQGSQTTHEDVAPAAD
jgi:PAS domain S-box-containing protein